jgi:hypothetical protein
MTTIYDEFATLPTEIIEFGVGGPAFVGVRSTAGDPATDPTISALESRTLVFIAAQLETFAPTFPEVRVWQAPWLVFALSGVDVQANDLYTDGTYSYHITGQPITHYGFLLGPAKEYQYTLPLIGGDGYQAGLRIGAW